MAAPAGGRRPILVVDDEPRMIHFIRLNLEHDGFDVVEASSGTDALAQLRDRLPDLILLDVMMPDMDGFDAPPLPPAGACQPRSGRAAPHGGPLPGRPRTAPHRRPPDRRFRPAGGLGGGPA